MPRKTKPEIPNDWEFTVIRSLDEIKTIRPVWEKMQAQEPYPVINADIDRYLSVLQALEDKCDPLILLLKYNDRPRAMVIGRLEKHPIPVRIGYKTILNPKLRCLTVVYGGILGRPDEFVSALLVRELMKYLRQREIKVIFFNNLRTESPFYRQVRKIPNFLCRNHWPVINPHWRTYLPKSMEEFYASLSKNHRKHIRKYFNRLEKEYRGKVKLRVYIKPEELEQAIGDAVYISKNTYQSGLGVGFVDNLQKHILLNTAAAKGWLRIYILYINEEPASYELDLKYGRICFGEEAGYNPKWKDFNIGTITQLKTLEILCQEESVDFYDFGFGDAEYKQRLSDESWTEAAATYLFVPRFYPILINFLNSLNSGTVLTLTWIIQKFKLLTWIKRLWRKKLQKKTRT